MTNDDEEIICVQNTYKNENEGTDETTAPGKVNTSDHPIQHEEFVPGNEENEENDQMEQNGLSEKEIQDAFKNIKQGKRFPVWLYRGMVAEEVEKVPQDINGMKLYKIPASDDTWGDLTADCRYFVMQTSSRSTLFGTQKIGKCHGSWVCPNDDCNFRKTSENHQPNYVNWTTIGNNRHMKICEICNNFMVREKCGARKMVEYNDATRVATVYYLAFIYVIQELTTKEKEEI